ncbi:MAG: tetratricopeptide repeat protein, partial [Pyrinomonadaceae bacterium]|nr:tetratricopeptide repeat protein [Pyrinomonadaceae bacterium]
MRRSASITLILFAQCLSAFASEPTHASILALIRDGKSQEAVEALESFKLDRPEEFVTGEYDYLLARMYESNGDIGNAAALFQTVASSRSVLREYALWRLSQIARFSGNEFQERLLLYEIIALYPDGLIGDAANRRLAKSYYESRNYTEAIHVLTGPRPSTAKASGAAPSDAAIREELALLGNSHLFSGNKEMARSIFERLLNTTPNQQQPDDFALESVRGLDALDQAAGSAAELTAAEHVRRGWVYQFNREFIEARRHYMSVVNRFSGDSLAAESAYQIGRGYASLESFAEAFPWFERVLEQFPELPVAKDALLQAGSAYTRVGKHREAISRYRQYIDRFPDDERLDRAYLNIVDVARDSGEETAALRQAAEAQQVFKGRVGEAQALFSEARIYISVEEWEKALDSLDRLFKLPDLGGTRVPGGTTQVEVMFLRAFILEQLSRYREAIEAYLSIPDGRNEYYGWRATERLMQLASSDAARAAVVEKLSSLSGGSTSGDHETKRKAIQSMLRLTVDNGSREQLLDSLRSVYQELPAYSAVPAVKRPTVGEWEWPEKVKVLKTDERRRAVAEKLLFLGLYDEAATELEMAGGTADRALANRLTTFYVDGDIAYRGVAMVEPIWRTIPADYQIELMPRESVELLYPTPYLSLIHISEPTRQ